VPEKKISGNFARYSPVFNKAVAGRAFWDEIIYFNVGLLFAN
jgi:hypothetical protein